MLEIAIALTIGIGLGALVATGRDRRRRRRLDRELDECRRRLAAARDARDTFFDLTTHELRSPLSAILGYQELLREGAVGALPEKAREPIARIGRSARHLLDLIDGIIELSRIRTGAVQLDLETVDMRTVCASVAEAFTTRAAERGLTPHVEIPEQLPTVRTDPGRLLRALDLAVISGVRHPAGDRIRLEVVARERDVSLTIAPVDIALDPLADPADEDFDHGPGAPPGDPVRRLGVRLAVVGRVAELLGGGLDLPTRAGRVRAVIVRIGDLPASL